MFLIFTLACAASDEAPLPTHHGDMSLHGAGDIESASEVSPPLAVLRQAVATLEGRAGSHMIGSVTFSQAIDLPNIEGPANSRVPVVVSIQLSDAGPGNHAVFLHEKGDCSAPDASSAGPWYGPPEGSHRPSLGTGPGDPTSSGPPPGYLGFVTVSADGRGDKDLVLHAFTLAKEPQSQKPLSLVERAVVVYERAPDFTRGGDPGARVACGVIRG